jgi:hypothetical protein
MGTVETVVGSHRIWRVSPSSVTRTGRLDGAGQPSFLLDEPDSESDDDEREFSGRKGPCSFASAFDTTARRAEPSGWQRLLQPTCVSAPTAVTPWGVPVRADDQQDDGLRCITPQPRSMGEARAPFGTPQAASP